MLKLSKYFFRLYCLISFKKLNHTHFGTNYGGWKIPDDRIDDLDILLSAGIGLDMSFEIDLANSVPSLTVQMFDPTPLSVEHVSNYFKNSQTNTPTIINGGHKRHHLDSENEHYKILPKEKLENFTFHNLGWSKTPEKFKFYLPEGKNMISYSTEKKTDNYLICECKPVSDLLPQLQIQLSNKSIIKMDIEGSEYGVIDDLRKNKLLPSVLLFEIHVFNWKNFLQLIKTTYTLLFSGYRCFYMDGDNYGFVK
ncbi:FkbM family methyltransferase [Marinoscillum pacificum]|uniref:FkbM family methyltransferase n=1 Tax=Marinoscillum pacificum TaxID=392723 RepID=UPI0021575002|nr:FkbM family methyltransferase [Marinoscillum pacificum]